MEDDVVSGKWGKVPKVTGQNRDLCIGFNPLTSLDSRFRGNDSTGGVGRVDETQINHAILRCWVTLRLTQPTFG